MSLFSKTLRNQVGDTISAVQQWCRHGAATRHHTRSARLGRTQAGDTIVEVLIAIAIISVVLVGAYAATTRNSAIIAATQEREQAQRLVEGQIEYLANAGKTNTSTDCFTPGSGADSGALCTGVTAAGSGAAYALLIVSPGTSLPATCQAASPKPNVYSICAYWTGLGAKTNDDSNVTMYYRVQ